MTIRESSDDDIARAYPPRSVDSHKGENGVVLVVGGGWLYHGAPLLTALAAMRTGVDLAYVAVPEKIATALRAYTPSLIVIPLPDLKLTTKNAYRLRSLIPNVGAAAIGPGMTVDNPKGLLTLITILNEKNIPLVIDASALIPDILPRIKGKRCVITPHAGEFRRMFGIELGKEVEERASKVSQVAREHGITILLKGHIDVISDGEEVVVNRTGNPAMTVGGTGDILCGITSALIAKGSPPFEAAVAAARINGLVGEETYQDLGFHITPEDVINRIPSVLKRFDRIV